MARIAARDTSIYALSDPRSSDVRYIGKTYMPLAERLGGHIAAAKRGKRAHSASWIRELLSIGAAPVISRIETVPAGEDWASREGYWIAFYRSFGGLTNHTDGGDGWAGQRHSAEAKAKIGARHKGRIISQETRDKISAAHVGKSISEAARNRISASLKGRLFTAEHRQRMSIAIRNRPAEQINKGTKNGRAVLSEGSVVCIRDSSLPYDSLVQMFGVSKSQVARIRTGEHWKVLRCGAN